MKQFFEEYGGVIIILIVIAALLVLVGSVTAGEDGALTGKGLAGVISRNMKAAIEKFTTSLTNITLPN